MLCFARGRICAESGADKGRVVLVLRRRLLVVGSSFCRVQAARSHLAVGEVLVIAFSWMSWVQSLLGWVGSWLAQ